MNINVLGDPGGIRTHDPQLRRLLLYPTELPGQISGCKSKKLTDSDKYPFDIMAKSYFNVLT
jgi:hypothetical protein